MEMKSISDCSNFIDNMILCSIEKHVGFGNLEKLRDYMIGLYNDMIGLYNEKYIEEMMAMLAILSQIILIIEKFSLHNEGDIKKQHCDLRKRILAWLEVSNTKPKVDDQQ